MNGKRVLLAAVLALGFTGQSRAQTILFNNLLQPTNGAAGFTTLSSRLASDFLTAGSATMVTSISARMGNSSLSVLHTVTFSIFTDNGSGKPGSLVGTFDTPATLPPNDSGLFTATSPGITLLPNTAYWLVGQVDEDNPTNVIWRFNVGQGTDSGSFSTVAGTQFQLSTDGGANYLDDGVGNLLFALQGASIPEPQIGLALLGAFGAVRIWKGRKAEVRREVS
jgi:hypothetical protein